MVSVTVYPFVIPSGIPYSHQVDFCKSVIEKLRAETVLLRKETMGATGKIRKLEQEIEKWKEKIEHLRIGNDKLRQERDRLKKEEERLKKEIGKLTKTQNRYQIALFDHGNFHHPDGTDKKPPGGQKGHADTNKDTKREYQSFTRQRVFAVSCGNCGTLLPRVGSCKEKVLIDIQINTQLTQVILGSERQWCKTCHKEVLAHSPQALPFTEYGMNTFMMVMLMHFKSHQSIQKISTVLSLGFGLTISPSAILSLLRQAKVYLQETYEEMKQAIREGAVMYNDETGWLVHGQKAWMWIMTTSDKKQIDGTLEAGITVYVPAESRGKGIFEEMYGNSTAKSMHDGYSSYESVTGEENSLYCWSHVLRFAFEETVAEKNSSIACQIRDRLVTLYQTIREHPDWTDEQKEILLGEELTQLIAVEAADETSKNIQHRITTQKEGLIKALLLTPDGTNNLAERELRGMAIHRTISFGSATFKGMETTAILGSVVQTISRNKEKPFLPTLQSYLSDGIQEKYPQYKHPPSYAP